MSFDLEDPWVVLIGLVIVVLAFIAFWVGLGVMAKICASLFMLGWYTA
jgi:hypothetical protein